LIGVIYGSKKPQKGTKSTKWVCSLLLLCGERKKVRWSKVQGPYLLIEEKISLDFYLKDSKRKGGYYLRAYS
jgi:hypothetical protein